MKILHLGQVIGGLDIYIRNSIIYAEGDYEYILVHGDKDNNKPIEKNGERVKEYGISLYRNLNLWNDFKAIIQAVRIITSNPQLSSSASFLRLNVLSSLN